MKPTYLFAMLVVLSTIACNDREKDRIKSHLDSLSFVHQRQQHTIDSLESEVVRLKLKQMQDSVRMAEMMKKEIEFEQAQLARKEFVADSTQKTQQSIEILKNKDKFLTVSWNHEPKSWLWGGLKNVRLQIVNNSTIPIGKAKLKLNYWLQDGSLYKSETLSVPLIAPRGIEELNAPDSDRGVKISYEWL